MVCSNIPIIVAAALLVLATGQPCTENCGEIDTDITINGDEILITWNISMETVPIYGFRATIADKDGEMLYTSPILHGGERSMIIKYELDGESSVCLGAMSNATDVIMEACEVVKISDLKMVIGILAGTIFLVPCGLGLGYIIYKDHKMRKMDEYEQLEHASEISEAPVLDKHSVAYAHDKTDQAAKVPNTGKDNAAFVDELNAQSKFKQNLFTGKAGVEKPRVDTNHGDHVDAKCVTVTVSDVRPLTYNKDNARSHTPELVKSSPEHGKPTTDRTVQPALTDTTQPGQGHVSHPPHGQNEPISEMPRKADTTTDKRSVNRELKSKSNTPPEPRSEKTETEIYVIKL